MDNFRFQLNTNLFYGIGSSRNIGKLFNDNKYEYITILIDEGVYKNSKYFDEISAIIKDNSKSLEIVVLRGSEEPDYDYLDEIADKVRSIDKIDVLIGIGGGSCLDVTKAAAGLRTNAGKAVNYRGFDKLINPSIPTIAIPTTAGTGSEVTINASFIDKKEMKKLGINGRFMHAAYAILDAMWTISCPYSVAVSSGMDALTHSLESYMCKQANPITRGFSIEAFRLLYKTLPALADDPDNLEKRQTLLCGSYIAAIGLFNSGSGIAGGFSYPLGVYYGIPHGVGGAIFLPSVIEYNVDKGYRGYDELYDIIEYNKGLSSDEKNIRFVKAIKELSVRLKVPEYLDKWGINKGNVNKVYPLLLPLQGAFDQNPVSFSADVDAPKLLDRHVK
ncbi:MAG: iron-containing alcohol dehydrogenase [Nitrospirae bacterium]|nr:iron-containing alcohol dehydrogenase [Nitrospirota bacterium]MBF0540407.1 iron-containing alcohol dehydrogenase [Nitrospirota bacterium]